MKLCQISYRLLQNSSSKAMSPAISERKLNGEIYNSMDYSAFLLWIKENTDLLKFLLQRICPMQWLSCETVKGIASMNEKKKSTVENNNQRVDTCEVFNTKRESTHIPLVNAEEMMIKTTLGDNAKRTLVLLMNNDLGWIDIDGFNDS